MHMHFKFRNKANLFLSVHTTAHVPVGSLSVYWNLTSTPAAFDAFVSVSPKESFAIHPKNDVA